MNAEGFINKGFTVGQGQPLFCFDDYKSPFTSQKEGNVIRGPSARRKRVLVVFLFSSSESGLM